jgi:hypothetical protein
MRIPLNYRSAIIPALLGVTQIAQADWQYSKWGMTVEEVRAASNGAATGASVSSHSKGASILLQSEYRTGEKIFDVAFFFDRKSGGLIMVRLSQRTSQECHDTLRALHDEYGSGEDTGSPKVPSYRWHDEPSVNVVEYTDTAYFVAQTLQARPGVNPSFCVVNYSPWRNDQGL